MKIIILASYARSLINFRLELIRALVAHGCNVVAFAPDIGQGVRQVLDETGVRCVEIRLSRTGLNPLADFQTLLQLIYLFKREKPNRILAYTIKPVFYGSLAAKILGIQGMCSMITGLGSMLAKADQPGHSIARKVFFRLYRFALKGNNGIFFQNPDDLRLFKAMKFLPASARPVLINGSGVDTELFSQVPLPAEDRFLLIARLIRDKGIREYVQAAHEVKKSYPKAVFQLAGWFDSSPGAISRQEVEKWVREGIIEYLGKLEDVRPALARARVYVLPSYREGTPRSVLEAMSMGRPVVTTDAPGCRETVINGRNGFLVPPYDSEELARAMMKFIENPALAEKMGHASREIAVQKYDVHKVNKIILDALDLNVGYEGYKKHQVKLSRQKNL